MVTGDQVLEPGWLAVSGGRITDLRAGSYDGAAVRATTVTPGAVDVHMHGGGGADVTAGHDEIVRAVAFHRRRGSTGSLASLVSAPVGVLCAQLAAIADVVEAGAGPGLLGAHLEGPFLARAQCGAHDPDLLVDPDPAAFARLLGAARGHLRTITVAPELPGALELVDAAVAAGVVVSVGHTDADYEQTRAAFARGARAVTHLGNAMRPMHHRDPGPIAASLEAGVACEVIADGVHVHPAMLRLVGPQRLLLVTDAISAAGCADGPYHLGGRAVEVTDGIARLVNGGALAGSTLTMGAAITGARRAGLSWPDTVRAASIRPAALLGLDTRLRVGGAADLLAFDERDELARVMAGGRWI